MAIICIILLLWYLVVKREKLKINFKARKKNLQCFLLSQVIIREFSAISLNCKYMLSARNFVKVKEFLHEKIDQLSTKNIIKTSSSIFIKFSFCYIKTSSIYVFIKCDYS